MNCMGRSMESKYLQSSVNLLADIALPYAFETKTIDEFAPTATSIFMMMNELQNSKLL